VKCIWLAHFDNVKTIPETLALRAFYFCQGFALKTFPFPACNMESLLLLKELSAMSALKALFAQADDIGNKYQTAEEIEAHQNALADQKAAIIEWDDDLPPRDVHIEEL
jgi:hypothetical protein